MKRTRILGGFSLVEMMLLLLITSLMLASGVTVISKKHVKVPKIAMHGAYMCYYKNGVLHEEKYVGAGLRKKILDRDVTECRFQPPDRSSYMHIQAVGGGGGGGDSGYKGGNLRQHWSKTEVISPFGITENLLKLKGMSVNELQTIGGNLYAYANASGELGDAGDGGDLYYIVPSCSSEGDCLVHREWEYTGNRERECNCKKETVYSRIETWKYDHECYDSCSYVYDCAHPSPYPNIKFECTGYETLTKYDSACDNDSTYTCQTYNTKWCYSKDECSGHTMEYCSRRDKDNNCTRGYYNTGCHRCTKDGECDEGNRYIPCTDECSNEFKVPEDAYCTETDFVNLTVETTDTFAQNTEENAPYRIADSNPHLREPKTSKCYLAAPGKDTTCEKAYVERKVVRDKEDVKTICNYGNPTKFTGVRDGIFGSFTEGVDGVEVNCNTADIMAAFGEEIFQLGEGQTTISSVVKQKVSDVYNVDASVEQARFPYYDLTEEKGQDTAYGTSCVNTYNGYGNCTTTTEENTNYRNPETGKEFKTQKKLCTDCDIKSKYTTKDGTQGCDGISYKLYGKKTTSKRYENITTKCSCDKKNSKDSECMYDFGQINTDKEVCQYIPAKASGGKAGKGKQCRTNDVTAGLNLEYVGNSSVVPGIRGSDINCTGAGFKPIYTESEYMRQPSCYAENGSDSQGYAKVKLGNNWCAANYEGSYEGGSEYPPGGAKGARKKATGATTGEDGQSAPGGSTNNHGDGKVTGSGYTTANARCNAGSENHVGYCLRANGTNHAVRENGKYTYRYSWNTNYLQYGEGGKAGAYRTMIIRSFKDRDIPITVGQGGKGGAEGTGNAGENGGDTIVGDILVAEGGDGGPGGIVTPTEQLPYWYEGGDFIKGANGTEGEVPNVANFKANVMNLVLPVDNSILGQWLAASGAGGNGGGSRNNCWASEWERKFEEVALKEATGGLELTARDLEIHGCRKGQYWSSTPVATDGTAGAVLIRW